MIAMILVVLTVIVVITLHKRDVAEMLVRTAGYMRSNEAAGLVIVFLLILVLSFPPLIGHSSVCIAIGFVWGWFPGLVIAYFFSLPCALASYHLTSRFASQRMKTLVAERYLLIIDAIVAREKADLLPRISTLLALTPLPWGYANFLLGVAEIGLGKFMVSKAIGCLPKMFRDIYLGKAFSDLAVALTTESPQHGIYPVIVVIGAVAAVAVTLLIAYYSKKELTRLTAANLIRTNR